MSHSESQLLTEHDLDRFLREHGDRIFSYLCAYCRSQELAAESLQSAYVKFIEKVKLRKVLIVTADSYLMAIARNEYLANRRKEKREVEYDEETHVDRYAANQPQEILVDEIRMIIMETVMDSSLPTDLSTVIRLRFLDHADVATICDVTGCSRSGVYRLMEKAIGILAGAFRKAGISPEDAGL